MRTASRIALPGMGVLQPLSTANLGPPSRSGSALPSPASERDRYSSYFSPDTSMESSLASSARISALAPAPATVDPGFWTSQLAGLEEFFTAPSSLQASSGAEADVSIAQTGTLDAAWSEFLNEANELSAMIHSPDLGERTVVEGDTTVHPLKASTGSVVEKVSRLRKAPSMPWLDGLGIGAASPQQPPPDSPVDTPSSESVGLDLSAFPIPPPTVPLPAPPAHELAKMSPMQQALARARAAPPPPLDLRSLTTRMFPVFSPPPSAPLPARDNWTESSHSRAHSHQTVRAHKPDDTPATICSSHGSATTGLQSSTFTSTTAFDSPRSVYSDSQGSSVGSSYSPVHKTMMSSPSPTAISHPMERSPASTGEEFEEIAYGYAY